MGIDAYLQIFAVIAVVAILHVPLGNYMARVYTDSTNWLIEKVRSDGLRCDVKVPLRIGRGPSRAR